MVEHRTLPIVHGRDIAVIDAAIMRTRHISHADLMEEVADACVHWLTARYDIKTVFTILCGPGNNGGDGLAIARRLFMLGYTVRVFAALGREGSLQQQQYARTARLMPIAGLDAPWYHCTGDVLIDALFGVGLSGVLCAPYDAIVRQINALSVVRIAVNMPSGLGDKVVGDNVCVCADATLSLCAPKHSQLWACHERYIGALHVLPLPETQCTLARWSDTPQWLTQDWVAAQQRPVSQFAHKGVYRRVAIGAGHSGMFGAAWLVASACIRAGAGLTTLHLPAALHAVMHAALPEVLLSAELLPAAQTQVAVVGPGWGQDNERRLQLQRWLMAMGTAERYFVIDADALNLLAVMPHLWQVMPQNVILTPHPREFARLSAGSLPENGQRIPAVQRYAQAHRVTVVLKGKYSVIAHHNGQVWVNPTGNSALAKGGSGDVLSGVIAGYLAQGYEPPIAAALAVYHHGQVADMLIREIAPHALIARDVIDGLVRTSFGLH